jgi:hypothetical protein
MDAAGFDRLTKVVSRTGTRRGLVRLLAAVPFGVALAALLGDGPEALAKKHKQQTDDDHGSSHRRHRRKAEHRHQTGKDKENRTGKRNRCKSKSDAKTCAGTCGTVRNTCGKRVDCGPCTCATGCPQCQVCDAATGRCAHLANGTPCPSGNPCIRDESCQGGSCQGTPVVCSPCFQCVADSFGGARCFADPEQAGDSCNGSGGTCLSNGACLTACKDAGGTWECPVGSGACNCAEGVNGTHYCATVHSAAASCGSLDACPPSMFCTAGGTACIVTCI